MTVTLDLPPQIEKAYLEEAQARGVPVDAVVREVLIAGHPKTVYEQGLGLFGSREDAALLDEVVSIAYQERKLTSAMRSKVKAPCDPSVTYPPRTADLPR